MSPLGKQRLLGLRALLEDAVEHGSAAVERVHRETAARTFAVLELIPPVAGPARVVRDVHGAVVTGVYEGVRLANRAVGVALAAVIEHAVPLDPPRPGDDDQVEVTR